MRIFYRYDIYLIILMRHYSIPLLIYFIAVVVLMNLLNGLAVSDTAVIRDKAEIVTYIIRVETVSCFEAVLLGDPFNFLANWPAIKLLQATARSLHFSAAANTMTRLFLSTTLLYHNNNLTQIKQTSEINTVQSL